MTTGKNISGKCKWMEKIETVLDLDSNAPERQRFNRHSKSCPDCTAAISENMELKELFRSFPSETPAYVTPAVMRKIKSRHTGDEIFRRRDLGWGLASAIVGVLIAILFNFAPGSSEASTIDPVAEYELIFGELEQGGIFNLSALESENGQTVQ